MARHNLAEVLAGAVVLVVAGGFLAYALAHSGRSTASGYELTAQFDHIDGLAVGGDVRMAGVKVGSVINAQIDPKTYLAVVTLTVRDGVELPKDSAAEIDSDSLLGGKYISLSPGGEGTMLKPCQRITITQSAVSLEQLLGKFIFSATNLASGKSGGSNAGQGGGSQGGGPQGGTPQDGGSQGGGQGGGLPPLGGGSK